MPYTYHARPFGATPSGWPQAGRVVKALFIREANTRAGYRGLGLLWAMAEPLMHVLLLVAIFRYSSAHRVHADDYVPFVALGVSVYLLFRQVLDRCSTAVDANSALFLYPQVLPLLAVFARFLLEAVLQVVALSLGLAAAMLWMPSISFPHPEYMAVSAFGLLTLTLGLGMTVSALTFRFPALKRALPTLIRPLYFLSAVFYPLAALTGSARILEWNPLAHGIELLRQGALSGYQAPQASIAYLLGWALAAITIGLGAQFLMRKEMRQA